MATSMEADSEVHFKERQEGKGVKTETAGDDATLQFEFRASTPAASPSGRGAEHRGGDAEEPRRIELKKFSLRPEKYDGKVDFEGWVNQFDEYATLGQWTEEEKSSLLFLSLTAGARMYFVGLPEREKMAYATRVETRFCIDYRRLNQATKVDAYPLPHIEDSLNTLGGARFFCSLDLASGYWQVEMDAVDREKTAFVTQGGLYEFRVMPFGLVNTPTTFERLMERVLRGIAWSECLVYLDDILVFGPDFGTTLARLEKVLDRLGEAGLKLKAKKCQLFQEEIPFLGHIVSAAGIGADPTKCQQVRDWPVPRDLHEVRSFVGLCSYYRRHIQGFTELAAPLYDQGD